MAAYAISQPFCQDHATCPPIDIMGIIPERQRKTGGFPPNGARELAEKCLPATDGAGYEPQMRPRTDLLQRLAFVASGYVLLVVILTDSTAVRLLLLALGLLPLALSVWAYRRAKRLLTYRFARTWPCVMPLGAKPEAAANDNVRWRKRRSSLQ